MSPIAMEHFHTAGADSRDRLGYWNDLCTSKITRVRIDSAHREHFTGEIRRLPLGVSTLYSAASVAAAVRHEREDIRRYSTRVFKVMLLDEGRALARANGSEFPMQAGDFTLVDSARPWTLAFDAPVRVIMLQLPAERLLDRAPQVEDAVGIHHRSGSARTDTLASFIRSVHESSRGGVDPAWAQALDRTALDLAAAAVAPAGLDERAAQGRAYRLACQCIRERLADPELDLKALSDRAGVTPRALQLAFARTGTTPMAYLLARRLERAAALLEDGRCAVTQAALSAGFTDLSHFGRAFRARHGVTPRAYREGQRAAR